MKALIRKVGWFFIALLAIAIASVVGYFVRGCRESGGGEAPHEWRVSQRTGGRTAEDIRNYKRRIDELEQAIKERDAKLLAAVQADFVAPAKTTTHEAEVLVGEPNILTWTWLERGGGTGLADFDERNVRMDWNDWRFPVDVELTREKDGQIGVTVSTSEPGLVLEQTRFYADDPWKERWYEKFEAGLAAGWGNGFTAQGHFGYSGWNLCVQKSGLFEPEKPEKPEKADTTVMLGKTVRFF